MNQRQGAGTSAAAGKPRRVPPQIPTDAGEIELVPAYAYFAPAEEVWQRLQDLHHRALGEEGPFATEVANDLTPEDAFSAYSHTSIAFDAQLAVSGLEARDQMLHSLGDFVESHGADGLEGALLNAGWSAREAEGALDYTGQVLREAGLPDTLGGGAETAFLFDAHDHQLGFVERDGLADRLGLGSSGHPGDTSMTPTSSSPEDQFEVGMRDLYANGLGDPAFDHLAPGSDPTGLGTSVDLGLGVDVGGDDSGFDPQTGGEGGGLETDSGGDSHKKPETTKPDTGHTKPDEGTKPDSKPDEGTKPKGGEGTGSEGASGGDSHKKPDHGGEGKTDDIFDKVERVGKATAAGFVAGATFGGIVAAAVPIPEPTHKGALVLGFAVDGAKAGFIYGVGKEIYRHYKNQDSHDDAAQDGSPYVILPGPETGCPLRPDEWPHAWAETVVAAGDGLATFVAASDDGVIALDGLPGVDDEGHVTDPGFLTAEVFEAVGFATDDILALYPDYDPGTSGGLGPDMGLVTVGAEDAEALVGNVEAMKRATDALIEGLATQDRDDMLSATIEASAAELSTRADAIDDLVARALRQAAESTASLDDNIEWAAGATEMLAATRDTVRMVTDGLEAWKLVASNQEPVTPEMAQELQDHSADLAAHMENLARLLPAPDEVV